MCSNTVLLRRVLRDDQGTVEHKGKTGASNALL